MSNVCAPCQKEEDDQCRKNSIECFEIKIDEILGRCTVANRDISADEVIMRKKPLVLGPKTISMPLCLGCHKTLNLEKARYDCKKCNWPLCSEKCETSFSHQIECEIFAKTGFKADVKNNNSKQTVYACILPIRAIFLKKAKSKLFETLLDCESHLDKHSATTLYKILKHNLVPFLINTLKIDTNENEILTICSIFDTNCFEVRDSKNLVNIRGLFPVATFLSHDCKPNTKHFFQDDDFEIVLIATVPIKNGELITVSYTQTLWGTLERRAHLKFAKHFDCICDRCKDPTEFGTYIGSFKCENCKNGKMLSFNPLDSNADWFCKNCRFSLSAKIIMQKNKILEKDLTEIDKTNIEDLENFLVKYRNILHEKNAFCLQIKHILVDLYEKTEDFKRKAAFCQELLEVGEILEPGHSWFRGLLLFNLHEALTARGIKNENESDEVILKYLQEANVIFKSYLKK